MEMTKDEALKMAEQFGFIKYKDGIDWASNYDNQLINLITALEQPSNMVTVPLDKLQDMQRRLKVLEQPLTRNWKETIDERIARDSEFKEALEQLEGKEFFERGKKIARWADKQALEQPAQEPVAWMLMGFEDHKPKLLTLQIVDNVEGNWMPLYTHPYQWQGLTDDEVVMLGYESQGDECKAIKLAEQALKEKNHD